MPSFSIASCSNGAEIHEKTNWFSEEVRPLNRTKMKINISFKNQDVGKEKPTSKDLFSCLKRSA